METAILSANELSEDRIKELIRSVDSPSAVPKLDRSEYTGKLLKADYAFQLVDSLREANQNDYGKVAEILQREAEAAKKKGFGSNPPA